MEPYDVHDISRSTYRRPIWRLPYCSMIDPSPQPPNDDADNYDPKKSSKHATSC